jgi:hypothetical protein
MTQYAGLTAPLLLLLSVGVSRVLQEVGCHLQRLSDVAGRWVGWSDQQDRDQRLAAQQELLDRAGHFGQLLGLVAMGAMALRAGRLWEVHQVGGACSGTSADDACSHGRFPWQVTHSYG